MIGGALLEVLLVTLLLLTAATATTVVLTREPGRQAIVLSAYGLLLGVLMLALQAPDVALSQLAIGAAIVPLLVVLAISRCDREVLQHRRRRRREEKDG